LLIKLPTNQFSKFKTIQFPTFKYKTKQNEKSKEAKKKFDLHTYTDDKQATNFIPFLILLCKIYTYETDMENMRQKKREIDQSSYTQRLHHQIPGNLFLSVMIVPGVL